MSAPLGRPGPEPDRGVASRRAGEQVRRARGAGSQRAREQVRPAHGAGSRGSDDRGRSACDAGSRWSERVRPACGAGEYRKALPSGERVSDVWPDWSTELGGAELARRAAANRPEAVLREAIRAVAVSAGWPVLLMALLGVLMPQHPGL